MFKNMSTENFDNISCNILSANDINLINVSDLPEISSILPTNTSFISYEELVTVLATRFKYYGTGDYVFTDAGTYINLQDKISTYVSDFVQNNSADLINMLSDSLNTYLASPNSATSSLVTSGYGTKFLNDAGQYTYTDNNIVEIISPLAITNNTITLSCTNINSNNFYISGITSDINNIYISNDWPDLSLYKCSILYDVQKSNIKIGDKTVSAPGKYYAEYIVNKNENILDKTFELNSLSGYQYLYLSGLTQEYTDNNYLAVLNPSGTGEFNFDGNVKITNKLSNGNNCQANGDYSHAEGIATIANAEAQHVAGKYNAEDDTKAYIIGGGSDEDNRKNIFTVDWDGNVGSDGELSAKHIHTASGLFKDIKTDNLYVTNETVNNSNISNLTVTDKLSNGNNCQANSDYSHAEGRSTVARGYGSHSEGEFTSALGWCSHAEGHGSLAKGYKYVHIDDEKTIVNGFIKSDERSTISMHAEGRYTSAMGTWSHAEGESTCAGGNVSHAEGFHTIANNQSSHSEGSYTSAMCSHSHAEGLGCITSGFIYVPEKCSAYISTLNNVGGTVSVKIVEIDPYIPIPTNCQTNIPSYNSEDPKPSTYVEYRNEDNEIVDATDGGGSHAEGYATSALYPWTHTGGYCTTSISAAFGATIIGTRNKPVKNANFVVGCGTIDENKNVTLRNSLYTSGNNVCIYTEHGMLNLTKYFSSMSEDDLLDYLV